MQARWRPHTRASVLPQSTSGMIKRYARNRVGQDWVVGDIHGYFSSLQARLHHIRFNPQHDRLFAVGDLIDRGPECKDALQWLAYPWFQAVQGNHEAFAVAYVRTGQVNPDSWRLNGGNWFLDMSAEDQRTHAEAYAQLPLVMEVETEHGLVGIVHAACPVRQWQQLDAYLARHPKRARAICQWSDERLMRRDQSRVAGVRAVVVGHSALARPTVLGNVYYIDTAGWRPTGCFTLLNLATLHAAAVVNP